MASSYTDLGTELMTTGENAGSWGTTTNTNLQILEEAVRGYVAISANSDQTLSLTDGSTGDSIRNAVIAFTGTLSANRTITVPALEKWWIMDNQTAGAYTLTVKVSGQTGITWGASDKGTKILYGNGTDVVDTNVGGGVGAYDLNGNTLTLDADADTDITADTDDQIDIKVGGTDRVRITTGAIAPSSADGMALGTSALEFSDLFLADSSVIKFGADQDTTLTHTDGTGLTLNSTNKLCFYDTALSISSSTDGQLDIDADTEVEIATTTLDLNGALDVSGASQFSSTITVGVDDTGYDVKLFGASAGAYALWDESADLLDIRGATAAGPGYLKLTTGELTVVDADKLGRIDFQAPLESSGTDAILVGASIWAEADDTFAAGVNNTDLVFALGKSEAAAEKFRFTADGEIGLGGANYGSDGQVLTSGGAGAAAAWETITAAAVTAVNNATANELVTVGATTAATVTTAAQTNITSLGTLTALTVDDVAINGKVVTMTGSTSDTAVLTAGTNGTLSIVTTDDAAAAANMTLTADGTFEADGTTVTLDSAGDVVLDAGGADVFLKDDGTLFGTLTQSGGELVIKSSSSGTTALTFSGANATFAGTLATAAGGFDVAGLDIDGATDIGAAVVDADLFIVDDGAGGTNRKVAASRVKTYIGSSTPHKTLLLTSTITSDTTEIIVNNSYITSTYRDYFFTMSNMHNDADQAILYLRYSTDNGSNYLSSAYDIVITANDSGGGAHNDNSESTAQLALSRPGAGNTTGEHMNIYGYIYNPLATDNYTTTYARYHGVEGESTQAIDGSMVGFNNAVTAVDTVKFYMSGGNIDTAVFKFYGIT
jgi:hypothetical protein